MSPAKKNKSLAITYEQLMARRRRPKKPFLMSRDDYEKLMRRKEYLASSDARKVLTKREIRREQLMVYRLMKLAMVFRPLPSGDDSKS